MSPDEQAALVFLDAMQKAYPAMIPLLKNPALTPFWVDIAKASQNQTPLSTQEMNARLWATDWWKNTPESERNWQTQKLSDPKTAAQARARQQQVILQVAGQMGVNLQGAQLDWLTEAAMNEGGLDATTVGQRIASQKGLKAGAGAITALATDLSGVAANYGVPMSRSTVESWSRNITAGTASQEGFTEYLKNQAKATFPSLAKELDQGMTIRQLADPYLQIASQTLGLDAQRMSLSDPKWMRALQSRDKQGNAVGPMSMQDWQTTLTTDKTYGYEFSSNAKKDAYAMVDTLGQDFGVR